ATAAVPPNNNGRGPGSGPGETAVALTEKPACAAVYTLNPPNPCPMSNRKTAFEPVGSSVVISGTIPDASKTNIENASGSAPPPARWLLVVNENDSDE